jgi:hypothetical protein
MPTFFLIEIEDKMPRWCELAVSETESFWVDMKGRRIARDKGAPIVHAEGDTIDAAMACLSPEFVKLEKDLAMRFLLDPWSDQGWVSPDGRFYGCAFFAHDDIAYSLIRKSPGLLEHEGWLRVHTDSFRRSDWSHHVTVRQERTIMALGFEDAVPGARRKPGFAIDRNLPAPSYAVKPPARAAIDPPKPKEPDLAEVAPLDLSGIIDRLSGHPDIGCAFETIREEIPDVGGGIWIWMVRYDSFDIGSDVPPEDILSEAGIHLMATSFDTIEVSPWPFAGIHIDAKANDILGEAIERSGNAMSRKAAYFD